MRRLTDLREILHYVPQFRDRLFVIALDGAIVEEENFPNLLLDIALLRSLNVRVALVHGAARQIARAAAAKNVTPSDLAGTGITDAATLDVALTAANRVAYEILEGLSNNDLRGAIPNAIVAHPAGILGGVDHLFTGRVERVDTSLLTMLLEHGIIPVVPPVGCDGAGSSYRLNSDAVAYEIAKALGAVKLVYLCTEGGIRNGSGMIRQMTIEEADAHLRKQRNEMTPDAITKLSHAIRAGKDGVERVHIIDGREEEGLLGEVFSNEGIGTLIYANEYQAIRPALRKDARALFALIERGIESEELVRRNRADIERSVSDYFLFEVDRNPIACFALHMYPDRNQAELASVFVDPRHENKGIGSKLITYAESVARSRGVELLFCLSTQAINYFIRRGGFRHGSPDDLPPARREIYDRNGRRSQVLVKRLVP